MNSNENTFRHGDMFFIKLDESKVDLSKHTPHEADAVTVGLGEVNGHAHVVEAVGEASLVAYADSSIQVSQGETNVQMSDAERAYFEVKNGTAVVTHEEHGPIVFTPGLYLRVVQIEYNPFREELQRVRD